MLTTKRKDIKIGFLPILWHFILPVRPLGTPLSCLFSLAFAVFLQLNVIDRLFMRMINIDLICLWLVTIFVEMSFGFSVFAAIFCSLLVEMHSPAPKGLYSSIYLIVCAAIFLVKKNITWHRPVSWLAIVFMVEVFSASFEVLTKYLATGSEEWLVFPLRLSLFLSELVATLIVAWFTVNLAKPRYRKREE